MAAGAGRHGDQPVGALANRRMGMTVVDDVMQNDAAVGMHGVVHLWHRAERRDDDGNLVFDAHRQVMLQPFIGAMNDLVDGEGGGGSVRVAGVVCRQLLGDHRQPLVELAFRPGVEGGKSADDAGLALGDRQGGMGDNEQRRADQRQPQMIAEDGGKAHLFFPSRRSGLDG